MHQPKCLASVAVAAVPAALIALSAGTAVAQPPAPPTPSPGHATKLPIDHTNRNCDGSVASPNGTGSGTGSAVFNIPGPSGPNAPTQANAPNKIIVDVSITNAMPNATYNVRLIQTPPSVNGGAGDCTGVDGTLNTDASGNGSVNVQEPVLSGAHDAFVALNNTTAPNTDFYTSPELTF